MGEVVQKTVAVRRGNHHGLEDTPTVLNVKTIKRNRRRTQRTVSRIYFRNVSQRNPGAAEAESHMQVGLVKPVPHGKDEPEVNTQDEQDARKAPRQPGPPQAE